MGRTRVRLLESYPGDEEGRGLEVRVRDGAARLCLSEGGGEGPGEVVGEGVLLDPFQTGYLLVPGSGNSPWYLHDVAVEMRGMEGRLLAPGGGREGGRGGGRGARGAPAVSGLC
ncbi:hypothetical protein Naga_101845g1 [Nannochloropsis gaditana]|uniref:Uncharacterized protein n=1 Tax=Nannochloropsis gaditana TaxID=72520 RepID=W7TI61_9STRA|nr:hypothetical protein Naga_101845g1 [Nannochloropsis gaditana]